ncbi:MAG: LpqB family beta-propeller domain-containing protein [Jatrophihabitantaceae bacterium]
MRRAGRALRLAAWPLAAVLLLAGCTGVPTSSRPQVVKTLGAAQPSAPAVITPQAGADPRSVVTGFLANNATDDENHSAARAFLTPAAKNRWADTTVTVVDNPQVGNFDSASDSVTVVGREIGTLDASGVYSPSLQGDGTGAGGVAVRLSFALKLIDRQWRIDGLQNGLLISEGEFEQFYQQHAVYFYDLAERHLVPDPRYSALLDSGLLANWLMTQMVGGQQGELQGAVSTEVPQGTDPRRVTVTVGSVIQIEVPGASQLDPEHRNLLAGQVALTLDQVADRAPMTITDGGRPVSLSQVGGTQFTAVDFSSALNPPNRLPELYYVDGGKVLDVRGRPMPGSLGTGAYHLNSVALATTGATSGLAVAGTSGPAAAQRLLVGTSAAGLKATVVRGRLSRPAWVPGHAEVWIGDGSALYRAGVTGVASAVPVTAGSGKVGGRLTAIRLSPEGSRVAIVITAVDGTAQIWVGAVVRAGGTVRVSNLAPISPQGVAITDVAWNDALTLFAIGREISTGEPSVYEVQSDGSRWTSRGIGNLPPPDSITMAENVVAAVSAGGTVWEQRAGSWAGLNAGTTYGTNPVYVE